MHTKRDLEILADLRLADSVLLLNAERYSSAYYLAGYAVELALKVCISKQIQSEAIPELDFIRSIYTHNLSELLGKAGLLQQFEADGKGNPLLVSNWGIVTKWKEHSRYEIWDSLQAMNLLAAINEPKNGVFVWVKKHW